MKAKLIITMSAMGLLLAACSNDSETSTADSPSSAAPPAMAETSMLTGPSLEDVINDERRADNRGRDEWRHPLDTLSFFGIEPDMTLIEVLPANGGWYTQILNPLTAEQGRLIGVTYPDVLFRQMMGTWNEQTIERMGADITQMARYLDVEGVEPSQPIIGYTIDNIPDSENGQVDAALFFRAMHHLFRFDEPLIDTALGEVYDALAPGGVVGVVQHRAPEDADSAFASGNNGYLKQSDVIAAFERAGFTFEEASEINANPNDLADGLVWRLPPTRTDNPETAAIGESDRMTIRFRKPS